MESERMDMLSHTVDGHRMDLFNLDEQLITPGRIANALARINRYGGQWRYPISVARHCLMVADVLRNRGYSPAVQLQGLYHDAAEAFTSDIPLGTKSLLLVRVPDSYRGEGSVPASGGSVISYSEFEDCMLLRIFSRLGLQWPVDEAVWTVDKGIYHDELPIISGEEHAHWNLQPDVMATLFLMKSGDLFREATELLQSEHACTCSQHTDQTPT